MVFAEEADFRYYLRTLEEFKDLYGVKAYGFCLMRNHIHLILQGIRAECDTRQRVGVDPRSVAAGATDRNRTIRWRSRSDRWTADRKSETGPTEKGG